MQNPPPVQASNQPPATVSKSSTGLDENVAALLAYIMTWVSGLVFFMIEKDSRLVRFHAMQAILLGAVVSILAIGLWIISLIVVLIVGQISGILSGLVTLVLGLLGLVLGAAFVLGWILCLIKAYKGEFYKLPLLGPYAEKFSMK